MHCAIRASLIAIRGASMLPDAVGEFGARHMAEMACPCIEDCDVLGKETGSAIRYCVK